MANIGRPRRGGGGRRGPPRGMGRRPPFREFRPPPPRDYGDTEDLGSREIDVENKKLLIEVKSNEQGKFVKITETQTQGRGRLILNIETAVILRGILDTYVADLDTLTSTSTEGSDSERLRSESFSQGRRRYFADVRYNNRGKFVKLTMIAGSKSFVALPLEGLTPFHTGLCQLLDEFAPTDGSAPPSPNRDPLPNSREVRAGGKTFFFDVERNDRGAFVRLSEVLRCLLYTSPSPRDRTRSRMPSSA